MADKRDYTPMLTTAQGGSCVLCGWSVFSTTTTIAEHMAGHLARGEAIAVLVYGKPTTVVPNKGAPVDGALTAHDRARIIANLSSHRPVVVRGASFRKP